MTTKTILQKENDALRERVRELENQLALQAQPGLALPKKGRGRDIGERKRAEEALRQSEQKYRQLFAEMTNGCALHEIICNDAGRPVDYITLEVNHVYESFLNTTSENVIGKKASEILPLAELEKWLEVFGSVALTEKSAHYEMYSPFNQKYFEGSVYCPEKGKFVVTFTDVTERKQTAESVTRSEARYRQALDEMMEGCQIIDFNWRYAYINEVAARQGRFTRPQLLGRTMMEMYPGIENTELFAVLRDCMENRIPHTIENRFTFADETSGYFELNIQPVSEGIFILSIDITKRKLAEEKLRESEAKHRLISETISDYLYTGLVYPDGRVETDWMIGAVEAITGYSEAELKTLPYGFASLVNPEDLAVVIAQQPQLLAGEPMVVEYRITTKSGEEHWLRDYMRPFQDETHAPAIHLLGAVQDITERKQAEEALQRSEVRLVGIVDSAMDGIITIDEEQRIVLFNAAAEKMFGCAAIELLGQPLDRLMPERFYETHREHLHAFARGEVDASAMGRRRDIVGLRANGIEFPLEASVSQVEVAGVKHYTIILRDITERKQAEENQAKLKEQLHQAQKMESIGRLAGGVAHDFNNLLTVILGYSELMQNRLPLSGLALERLEQIRQAAKRAEGLTRQLLAFSRKQVLVPEVFDLNELVKNLRKMLKRLIPEDIALITALQPDLWWVKADPGQIEQVIMNLVVNARDAMPTGGRLTLETANVALDDPFIQPHPETLSGHGVRLTVTDTGFGMDEEIQAHIFEPFFTTKEQGKGTGLGLAMVYGIIKQSGGEITVASQPGQGAAFTFYLPAHETARPDSTVVQPETVAQSGRETIMLVEDEPMVRDFVQVALRDFGYTLLEVNHGYQALALAQQENSIDLLLTDVVMPDINGRELAERIKALHPRLKVLFMSGYTDDEVLRHGVQMAQVEFIAKPFSPVALAAKVRALLDR